MATPRGSTSRTTGAKTPTGSANSQKTGSKKGTVSKASTLAAKSKRAPGATKQLSRNKGMAP